MDIYIHIHIQISIYIDIFIDIHVQHLTIKNYLWISWGIYINTPKIHTNPTAPLFSLKMETLRFVYISVKFVQISLNRYHKGTPLGYLCLDIDLYISMSGQRYLHISGCRLQVGRPQLLLHSIGQLPPDRATGTAGQGRIGLTEALARAGRPVQKDFKLGGPRCCCIVSQGHGHRPGPDLRLAHMRAIPVRKTSSGCPGPGPASGALGHCKDPASPAPWFKGLNQGTDWTRKYVRPLNEAQLFVMWSKNCCVAFGTIIYLQIYTDIYDGVMDIHNAIVIRLTFICKYLHK